MAGHQYKEQEMDDENENPNMTKEEIAKFEAITNAHDWDAACDELKHSRPYNSYPPDWFFVMNLSGRRRRIIKGWTK